MALVRVGPLPDDALAAAAAFHAEVLPEVLQLLDRAQAGEDVVLIFAPAPHDHHAWRLAAVESLARQAAPVRVNGLAGSDEAAITEALAFLAAAPGVTGQILAVDGKSAETG